MIRTEIVAIVERELPGTSDFYFNMMYSIYSLPNIVLPLFMGSLIDRIGALLYST
jgi:MFS family permease